MQSITIWLQSLPEEWIVAVWGISPVCSLTPTQSSNIHSPSLGNLLDLVLNKGLIIAIKYKSISMLPTCSVGNLSAVVVLYYQYCYCYLILIDRDHDLMISVWAIPVLKTLWIHLSYCLGCSSQMCYDRWPYCLCRIGES